MAGILDNPVGNSPVLQVDPNANTLHAVGPGGILGTPPLRQQIQSAYLDATGGKFNTRSMLSDIRARLPNVPRDVLDNELKQMQKDGQGMLYQFENRKADDSSLSISGYPRHILWMPQALPTQQPSAPTPPSPQDFIKQIFGR